MNKVIGFIKWVAILGAVGVVIYLLYKIVTGAGNLSDRISKSVTSLKSTLTPGWSSLVPLPGDMQGTMGAHYAAIQAAEPNLNTPNPNLPWYQKPISTWWASITGAASSNAGGTTGNTPQTLGVAQNAVNVAPLAIKGLTPVNQQGQVIAPPQPSQGTAIGTVASNVGPPASNNLGPTQVVATSVPDASALNYVAPGASTVSSGATGGLNQQPISGDQVDTTQNQFLGQ